MNWNNPLADDVEAAAFGLKSDYIFAVVSRYWKLVPVAVAACLIAPAIRSRRESTPVVAVALELSTVIYLVPRSPRNARPAHASPFSQKGAQRRSYWCGNYG